MHTETKVDSLYAAIRQRILDGEFGKAGRLPSLRKLATHYNSTHETLNKVVQRLQAEGLITSLGRAGVFVNFPKKHLQGITARFDLYLEEQGFQIVETDITAPQIIPASEEVANAFDIDEGTPVVRRYRRQGTTTQYLRLAENFYPVELVNEKILESMQHNAHFDTLAAIKETHHLAIKRIHEDVFTRLPTLEEQDLLDVVRIAPMFEIHRTGYTEEEEPRPIMYSRIIHVGSFFVLSYDYQVHHW